MRRLRYKISFVIVMYSLLLTLVFLIGITYFQYSMSSRDVIIDDSYIYSLSEDEYIGIYQGEKQELDSEHIVQTSSQYQEFAHATIQYMTPFAVVFCIFVIIFSFLLWFILTQLQKKQAFIISQQFQNVKENENFDFHDQSLNTAYKQIKSNFQSHLNDYKRLNSYLSHEQKNAIAILRATMEVHHQREYLSQLDYISNSIDDILTLSEQGEQNDMVIVDVALCCAEICDLYKKSYPQITYEFDEGHSTDILAKQRWILRALCNLIDNAIKYGQQKPIHVSVKNQHHSVIIQVCDQGIGMDKEQLSHIFNYQYRINELNRDGYGIGLSVVSHVCELCNGFAYVESQLYHGTTFYLSFPEYTGC